MNYFTGMPEASYRGSVDVFAGVEQAFGSQAATMNTLQFIDMVFNAAIGLFITLAVITYFAYLAGWYLSDTGSELHKRSTRGAIRAAIAIGFMVSIWGMVRLVQQLIVLSDVTAFVLPVFFFFLFGLWSLFSLGDALVNLVSRAATVPFDKGIEYLQRRTRWGSRMSADTLRLIGAMVVIVALSLLATSWAYAAG